MIELVWAAFLALFLGLLFLDLSVLHRESTTLTVRQASRLFGIERETCKAVVDRLVRTQYLKWTASGSFTRAGR